jgi:aminoglycoside phosphotransferase (APT) family kinase protein
MREPLVAWLVERLAWRGVEPASVAVERIGVGHSRAMFRVDAGAGRRVVVRVEQGGVFGTSSAEECRVMRSLAAVGFPVAPIVAEEPTGSVIGQPFFVMAFVDGAAVDDERAIDRPTAAAFVDMLHALHALDGADFGFELVPASPGEATPAQIERWRGVYRRSTSEPIPLLEEAAAWLHHRAPPLDRVAVVHGDAGPGNFVHDGGRVVAMTDFEFTHLGDPAEDWSFCVAMRGARTMPRADWLALFRERAGVELDDEQWRYWEAFNLFKGACANRTCLDLFERGVNRAPNMAIIGTTLHQVFLRRLVDIVHG